MGKPYTVIITLDRTREYFSYGVPIYAGILALGLIFLTWQSHAKLWVLDMERKTKRNECDPLIQDLRDFPLNDASTPRSIRRFQFAGVD